MANAYFNALSDASKATSFSAGTQPGDNVHPVVQEVCTLEAVSPPHAVHSHSVSLGSHQILYLFNASKRPA